MATAKSILEEKQTDATALASLPPTATVLEAAQLMNDRHIGAVVVLARDGAEEQLVGIFTERDVMRRVVAEQRDPSATRLCDVMTTPVAVASMHTTIDELRMVMRERRIRHLPVLDSDRPIGMVSIGDLNRAQLEVDERTIRYLQQYMSVT